MRSHALHISDHYSDRRQRDMTAGIADETLTLSGMQNELLMADKQMPSLYATHDVRNFAHTTCHDFLAAN